MAQDISMNDIHLLEYGDFTKTWKLITVRYRQDSQEMRFVYANSLAMDAISKGASSYPDGSVFAKVGFKSGVDPAFNSSIVPSGARRFQFMVKNSKKYPETDGWGYALFQSNGDLFEGDVKTVTQSCHACHKLVPERDYVFSEPIEVSPLIKDAQATYKLKKNISHIYFSQLEKKQFSNKLKKYVKNIKSIDVVEGEIRQFFFGGTLDELTPVLINNSLKTKNISGFVSLDQNTFKIIQLSESKGKCADSEYYFKTYEFRAEWKEPKSLEVKNLCYSKQNL